MGQKVNPVGLRIGISRDWNSRWYANNKDFATFLHEDNEIRKYLTAKLKENAVSHIEIERIKGKINVFIFTAAPGTILGDKGEKVKLLQKEVNKLVKSNTVNLKVVEVKRPDLDATIVAQKMAKDLENRASFRSVQKMAIRKVLKAGAVGCKTMVSGRLGGTDIARSEGYKEGVVSLHTLRQDVDYALAEASTTYGKLGCKVWISKGKVDLNKKNPDEKGE
jgi:small subunit ribosomal protein S3